MLRRELVKGRHGDRVVEDQLPSVDSPGEVGQREQGGGLPIGEPGTGMLAVAGDDDAGRELRQAKRRLRPIERVGVAEPGDGPVLEQVAGEQDAGSRAR